MTKSSDLGKAYRAGSAAVKKRNLVPMLLAAAIGVVIGRIIWAKFSLPWFEGAPIEVIIIVLLAFLFALIESRLRSPTDDHKQL